MAKVIVGNLEPRNPSKYDWETWLNGRTWRLVKGEDFSCKPDSLRALIYHAAARFDVSKVVLRVEPNGDILMQAVYLD